MSARQQHMVITELISRELSKEAYNLVTLGNVANRLGHICRIYLHVVTKIEILTLVTVFYAGMYSVRTKVVRKINWEKVVKINLVKRNIKGKADSNMLQVWTKEFHVTVE